MRTAVPIYLLPKPCKPCNRGAGAAPLHSRVLREHTWVPAPHGAAHPGTPNRTLGAEVRGCASARNKMVLGVIFKIISKNMFLNVPVTNDTQDPISSRCATERLDTYVPYKASARSLVPAWPHTRLRQHDRVRSLCRAALRSPVTGSLHLLISFPCHPPPKTSFASGNP